MHADLLTVSSRLAGLPTLDACLDAVQASADHLGCKALIYDYAPVPLSHDGVLITPSVFKVRNAPADMQAFWCERGYYQIDPVQQCASRRAAPFVWSFRSETRSALREYLGDSHRPVTCYVRDSGLATGVTVPLHLPGGAFATLTGILDADTADAEAAGEACLGAFLVLAHAFQARADELLAPAERRCGQVRLTPRARMPAILGQGPYRQAHRRDPQPLHRHGQPAPQLRRPQTGGAQPGRGSSAGLALSPGRGLSDLAGSVGRSTL